MFRFSEFSVPGSEPGVGTSVIAAEALTQEEVENLLIRSEDFPFNIEHVEYFNSSDDDSEWVADYDGSIYFPLIVTGEVEDMAGVDEFVREAQEEGFHVEAECVDAWHAIADDQDLQDALDT